MYKHSKLALKIFIVAAIMVWICFLAAAYFYDPLQVWHKPYFRELTYGENTREMTKARIRDNDFDSIIIGSSLSTNVSAKEANKKMHSLFINLSMDASPPPENKIILNYAIKQKKIKKVVYFLGVHYLGLRKEATTFPLSKYAFLYDNNPANDYKIYLNDRYSKCILTLSKSQKCIGDKLNMDKPYGWDDEPDHMKRFGGFDNWIASKNNNQIKAAFKTVLETPQCVHFQNISNDEKNEITDYLNKNVLAVVKKNPTIQFDLILPPISSLELARDLRSGDDLNFERQKIGLKYLASQNKNYDNLKIFAFDNLNSMGDIGSFKDLTHYHPRINSYILDSISANKNILAAQNVDKYISQTYEKAASYDFNYYFHKIKTLVK